jgi:transposase
MERQGDITYKEMRRIQGVEMYKRGFTQDVVAETFGVDQGTVSRWVKREKEGGRDALKSKPIPGLTPRLNDNQKEKLKELLLKSPKEFGFEAELWTSPMVSWLIKDQFGVKYHPGHVRKLLHAIGMSSQKPVKRATQRDEAVIKTWIKKEWPRIKKKV